MKKMTTLALVAIMALSASAAKKKAPAKDANKPVFTTIKENPITSIKDQNRPVLAGWFGRGRARHHEDSWYHSTGHHAFPRLTVW